jgi:hypothetical protein
MKLDDKDTNALAALFVCVLVFLSVILVSFDNMVIAGGILMPAEIFGLLVCGSLYFILKN